MDTLPHINGVVLAVAHRHVRLQAPHSLLSTRRRAVGTTGAEIDIKSTVASVSSVWSGGLVLFSTAQHLDRDTIVYGPYLRYLLVPSMAFTVEPSICQTNRYHHICEL
jgi:hypothetical protein